MKQLQKRTTLMIFLIIISMFTFFGRDSLSKLNAAEQPGVKYRRISLTEYRDKMKGGWIGQIAGVCWGAPTEFKVLGKIMPEEQMPKWKPEMINHAFGQDDLYVEMTFLRSMEQYGLDVSLRQAGIDFANSEYPLWHANMAGRRNLRAGIAPPDSSHPKFNEHADDIDYQIEADFSGLIAPGLPCTAIEMGEKFGRLMNYGDGVYAGIFVGAMYCEAFFEDDPVKIVQTALKAIPADCQYAEMVRDVLAWCQEHPDDWKKTWEKTNDKYHKNPHYRQFNCDPGEFNIDAKINGAFILIGLLHGNRDLDETIIISTRCGQDSDCNPSNSAGVLFTTLGFSKLPPRFSEKLDETKVFSHTAYNFPALINVCEKLARQAVEKEGGFVEKNAQGEEFFVIPVKPIKLQPTEHAYKPGPVANSVFTDAERKQIKFKAFLSMQSAVDEHFPGWTIRDCGPDMHPGIHDYKGRKDILLTHPKVRGVACVLSRELVIPQGKSFLDLSVSHHDQGDWDLIVKVDGKEIYKRTISKSTDPPNSAWTDIAVDLSSYAGKKVKLELLNEPTGWSFEAGYWSKIEIRTLN